MNKEEKIELMRQRHLAILTQARRYYQYQISMIQEDPDYKPTGILSDKFEEWKVLDDMLTRLEGIGSMVSYEEVKEVY